MPRIQDIGAFNAVREAGLSKLTPSIPRITVGMGTCGRGNGAEEVYHVLNKAIQRGGLDVLLNGVGGFGACFQEPLVGVRLPGNPLVILHRVRANDAARILESVSTAVMPPDLIYGRSRSGITSRVSCATARVIRRSRSGMRFRFSKGRKRSFCAIAG
jgi:NADH-quinone oxidoreductase subunit F